MTGTFCSFHYAVIVRMDPERPLLVLYNDIVSQRFTVEGDRTNLSVHCTYGPDKNNCNLFGQTIKNSTHMEITLTFTVQNAIDNGMALLDIRSNITLDSVLSYIKNFTTVIPDQGNCQN